MRTALIIGFVANLILTVASLILFPSEMAIHFGPGGEPDSWAPAYVNAIIMTGVETLLLLTLLFAPRLIHALPSKYINLPHKDYWLNDKNRERTISVVSEQLYLFGAATFFFLFIVGVLALQANLSDPVRFREDLFWWPFGLFMAFTVYWTIKIMLAFKLPEKELR